MKVFMARGAVDFGSLYEEFWKNRMEMRGCEMIELPVGVIPNRVIYGSVLYGWEKKYIFPLIDKCDFILALPRVNVKYKAYKGKLSEGVVYEAYYGLLTGKTVVTVELVDDNVRKLNLEDLEEYKKSNKNILAGLNLLEQDYGH